MVEFLSDLWQFLKVRKKLWLLPIVLMLAALGALVIATEQSSLAALIYAIY